MTMEARYRRLIRTGAKVVAAYVSRNAIYRGDVPGLIEAVYEVLNMLDIEPPDEPSRLQMDGASRVAVTQNYLISLEDGKRYTVLTRHLRKYGLTPERYREKWGLAADYPMTAPSYSKVRSDLAKSSGLGRSSR